MTQYWMAISNYFTGGKECASATCRSRQGWWWYLPGRDDPKTRDKAVVYQPSSTMVADSHGVKIPSRYKYRFLGDFQIKNLNPNRGRVYSTKKNFLWDSNDFYDLHELYDEIDFIAECIENYGNYGPCIQSKTWVSISRRDYDLIISHREDRNK